MGLDKSVEVHLKELHLDHTKDSMPCLVLQP